MLASFYHDELAPGLKDLDLGDLPVSKALGVYWNAESDDFVVRVNLREKPMTRRGVLSQASQLFDPFGMIQPFILPIKGLLQRLCQLNIGWDDPIPTPLRDIWIQWLRALHKLQTIAIPRWFGCCPHGSELELHCFSDASGVGYGAVCYIRIVQGSMIHCSFVLGKSRVCPIKSVTIPRLELSAATLAVKLARMITKELEIELVQTVFWTDSTTVLRYIENTSRRFSVFVANRLSTIHASSQVSQWRYVESRKNPADLASRGAMPDDDCSTWLRGPEFLWRSEDCWPSRSAHLPPLDDDDPELRTVKLVNWTTPQVNHTISMLVHHYSTWMRLVKAVAWMTRFKQYIMWKFSNKPGSHARPTSCFLSVEETDAASLDLSLIHI